MERDLLPALKRATPPDTAVFPSRSLNTTITVDEANSVSRGIGKLPVKRYVLL